MLVPESRRRSNPRVLYGMLAESALEQFREQPPIDLDGRSYFQNLVRLLEMYRYNTLRRTSPRAVLDRQQADLKSLRRDRADSEAVENALRLAHVSVYGNIEKSELVERLKRLFAQIVQNELADIPGEELTNARRFLEVLVGALRE